MNLDAIRELAADDMAAVNNLVEERLASDVVLINQLGHYIVHSGGKRLRPLVTLLAARASGYSGRKHTQLAAVVEFIHTATLLHDDVVDGSQMRRGKQTAHTIWGNEASVLVGDFLYTRAFEMMVELNSMPVLQVMAKATNTIARGEVMQLMNVHEPDISEEDYRQVIYRKTATLFEAGCQCGGILAGLDERSCAALGDFGRHLGTAYQLVDDALDYSGDAVEIGKNIGDDLAEGKTTMPLLHAMRVGEERDRELIRRAIESGGLERMEEVGRAIEKTGSAEYTRQLAEAEVAEAVAGLQASLPESQWRQALVELARGSVSRTT
ncbi:octaprenyl diphosphate synthase [Halorhodospira halochloris]|uniref:Octaprenyl diphosphate synthase n=1 Tax=Halorhodospira halochloris TaxID=1052 RepID=A0A0X8X937_HALHR|nr:octaprenyl diphosphate synthase [Halorhodospira halochloris]MBK1651391.1 octaprenyl diphosphate synthase [Halorhodospira halochloris]MCG5531169.1 octaprenyl diphosphate synthase [Halorhodospira halochloris]MCG5547549.1 octaprenyl diphosphate synthase [Halorhodospira halochloris]BAU57679.1 octaprenyl diphosphate synthase [Halorhodospira halochloris]